LARLISNGEVRVGWATAVADPANPTNAEVSGSTDVTPFMSSLDTPLDGDAVDSSDLSSAFNKTVAGKFGGNVNGTMFRDDTTDTAYDLFPRSTIGYLIVRRFGGSTVALTTGDQVEVWNLRVITRSDNTLDDNTVQAFTVNYAALDEPSIDVTVVA